MAARCLSIKGATCRCRRVDALEYCRCDKSDEPRARGDAQGCRRRSGRLRIGTLYSLTRNRSAHHYGMKLRRPELELDLTMGSNQMLLDMLEDDALDAILIATNEGSSIIPLSTWCRCLRTIFSRCPGDRTAGCLTARRSARLRRPQVCFAGGGFATYAGFRKHSISPASSRKS